MSRPPLLSACLIVKNEEDVIERCIASAKAVADEVVVLDTGSTDGTVALARAAGAKVFQAEWRDDFAWARNVAIGHATGRWILIVDADEEAQVADVAGLHRLLSASKHDGFRVLVDNVRDASGSVSVTHKSIRLFRRGRCQYRGRIHEQVVGIGNAQVTLDDTDLLRVRHTGYTPETMQAKGKAERNIRIAEAVHAHEGTEKSAFEVARARTLADDDAAALEILQTLRHSSDTSLRARVLQEGARILLRDDRPEEGLDWIGELAQLRKPTALTIFLHGRALVQLGRFEDALDVLDREPAGPESTVTGVTHSVDSISVLKSKVLRVLGREDEAVDVLLSVARTGPLDMWPELVSLLFKRGELVRACQAIDLDQGSLQLQAILAQLMAADAEVAEAFADALHATSPGHPAAFAFANLIAGRLDLERAVLWSSRARAQGLMRHCTLTRQAQDSTIPAAQRVAAAGLIVELFGDDEGVGLVEQAARDLPIDSFADALFAVVELAPTVLEPFVLAMVTTQARCLALAEAFRAIGALEQAVDIAAHGLELESDPAAEAPLRELVAAA